MKAPDVKAPDQGQSLGTKNADVKVSDLIGGDAAIKWTGNKGEATGTVKYNADMSKLFPESEKTGHFFPIAFSEGLYGEPVTISGRAGGDVVITPAQDDPYLIARLENLTDGVMTAKTNGEDLFSIDFNKATKAPQ